MVFFKNESLSAEDFWIKQKRASRFAKTKGEGTV